MRHWNNLKTEDNSVHCLGNGKMGVYEEGPDIFQIFGPPYSSPTFIKILIDEASKLETDSERIKGTAIWKHHIVKNDIHVGEFTDFVHHDINCFIRQLVLEETVSFMLSTDEKTKVVHNKKRFDQYDVEEAFLFTIEAGAPIYNTYPSIASTSFQVILKGENIHINQHHIDHAWSITIGAGESFIYVIGGPSYPECMNNAQYVLESKKYEVLLKETENWWLNFSRRRYDFEDMIPQNNSNREALMNAIDSVAVLIKTQQAIEGGILAGYNYRLGYVRDQYGVFRGLLRLGYIDEAKAILSFYWNIWKKHKVIHNAQAMGVDGIFHIHENDGVEITGYMMIMAFNYDKAQEDPSFLQEISPMLEWAWELQKNNLVKCMLPFNGDETYVAGGVLPRNVLNDGSAEATLLLITAGEKYLKWMNEVKLWDEKKLEENIKLLQEVKENYRSNFWKDNKLITNNPERILHMELPKFRHGVCEACQSFGWSEKNENNRYLCPQCFVSTELETIKPKSYYLQSVCLLPLYIGSDLFNLDEIKAMVDNIIIMYKKTGLLPSREDGAITVGYDYGLLLYALTKLKHPMAEEFYVKTLSVIDPTGAWVEYYENGMPQGTRYRPWESAINIEALIQYSLS